MPTNEVNPIDYHVPSSTYQKWLHSLADKFRLRRYPIVRALLSEFCGSFILIAIGCGGLAQVLLGNYDRDAHGGFLSTSLTWGAAFSLGVLFSVGNGSGYINPAITFAFALVGRIHFKRVPVYTPVQLLGCMFGTLIVYMVYQDQTIVYNVIHDDEFSDLTSTDKMFFTSPRASQLSCLLDQVVGTAFLSAGLLAISDVSSDVAGGPPNPVVASTYAGLLYFALFNSFCLNAGCPLNPSRDIGPRLVISLIRWNTSAFTLDGQYFWVPLVGPYIGAVFGAIFYEVTIGIHRERGACFQCPYENEVHLKLLNTKRRRQLVC